MTAPAVRQVVLRDPLPHTWPVLLSPARFKVVACGRRWTKTEGVGLTSVLDGHGPKVSGRPMWPGALWGKRIAWIAKTGGVSEDIWRLLKFTLDGRWIEKSEIHRRLVVPTLPGADAPMGQIEVRSGDEPDSLRGPGYDGIVIDEAAHQSEEVWTVLRPTLADRQGWAMFLSTPNYKRIGKWFRRLYEQAARLQGWERWRRPTSDNKLIKESELEQIRQTMAPLLYRQEHLAEFIEDVGAIFQADWFRYFREVGDEYHLLQPDGPSKLVPITTGQRFGCVDLATSLRTSADFTVIGSHQVVTGKDLLVLDMDRRRMGGPEHIPAMRRAHVNWRLGRIWVEKKGYQLATIQEAQHAGLPVSPLDLPGDKLDKSQPLQARMAAGAVYFREGAHWVPDLEAELLAFTGEPDGRRGDGLQADAEYYDDQVDELGMAATVVSGRHGPPRVSRVGLELPPSLFS